MVNRAKFVGLAEASGGLNSTYYQVSELVPETPGLSHPGCDSQPRATKEHYTTLLVPHIRRPCTQD